jgi:O-antigen/teichoic acid export membrane protein
MLKNKITSGLAWSYAERMLAQFITLGVSIILARLIEPEKFGIIALIMVFINIANIFAVSGLGNSLIQKRNADSLDFSTVFHFSIFFSTVLYLILFLFAPTIASFYKMPELSLVIKIMAIRIPLGGINSVQFAYVSKRMEFKKFFISTLLGTLLSAVIAIYLAYKGFGIWALVIQYLIKIFADTIIIWFLIDWKPNLIFSFERLKGLFTFGWKLLVAEVFTAGYNEVRSLVIGKMYSPSDLAFYNRGQQFPRIIVANINTSISKVLYPAIAENQENRQRVKNLLRRSTKTTAFILTPILLGLALIAKPLTVLVLTEKWLGSVPFMQILAVYYLFMPVHTISSQAITAIGRSDLHLIIQIIKIFFGLLAMAIAVIYFNSALAIALGALAATIINSIIHIILNKRMINYKYSEQIKDIFIPFLLSLSFVLPVYILQFSNINIFFLLVIQTIIGIAIYLALSFILKIESLLYIISTIKSVRNQRK